MVLKYSPVGNKILVKKLEDVNKTKSGLYVAETQDKDIAHGLVLGVGKDVNIELKEGETVAFDYRRGYKLPSFDSTVLLLLMDHEILATAQEE